MPKQPLELPDFSDGKVHLLTKEQAIYVLKKRADKPLVWTDFGWASLRKYELEDLLMELNPSQKVSVLKVPKFTVYKFHIA